MTARERIVQESTDMFVQHGVKSIRMDDIASRMGVSKRTIYELFGDRETLIMDCVTCFDQRQRAYSAQKVEKASNIIEELVFLLDGWEYLMEANIKFSSDLQRFYPAVFDKVIAKRHKEGIANLKMRLEQGTKDGIFITDINFDFASSVLTDVLYNVFKSPTAYGASNVSQTEAFKYIMIFFFRGISTEKGVKILDEFMARNKNSRKLNDKK